MKLSPIKKTITIDVITAKPVLTVKKLKKLRNEIKDSLPIPFYGLFDFYKKVLPCLIKLAFDLNGYYKVKLPNDQN